MNDTMIIMDNFFNLPIFISVFNILAGLFWYGYCFAFPPNVSNATEIYVSAGFVEYFVMLLITLTPAAAANQAAAMAREIFLSLPAWFPERYSIIKTSCAATIHAQICIDIVENLPNRQIFTNQRYRHSNFLRNSGGHSRKRPEFK
ncbi:hypothetical protein CEXT_369371 [Caerostris extrusa]|uniref:Uncharacterized protein n=1 Tax=Caerostris extrusa TaxID=172846 RepID=A0AAV4XGY1_CAEEX|nr:hypothetical protein CEXT_369371 [Caerostris extrusa]